jgi:transcription elongation factor Elf1
MSLEQFEEFSCPYCNQSNQVLIDITGGSSQSFVVDCEVCCAPIAIRIKIGRDEIVTVDVRRENE